MGSSPAACWAQCWGGLSFLVWTSVIACGIGYPVLFARGRRRIKQLPREEYLTWKHTLTVGTLMGTGAASAASLARSAGALLKGGSGSFGGGGALGAFGGGSAQAAAAAKGAAAPGAIALGTVGSHGSSPDDASDPRLEPAATEAAAKAFASSPVSRWLAWMRATTGQLRRFRWYHGVAFVLIGVIFPPVGMGVSAILQSGRLLLGLALVGLCLWGFVQFIATERYGELRRIGASCSCRSSRRVFGWPIIRALRTGTWAAYSPVQAPWRSTGPGRAGPRRQRRRRAARRMPTLLSEEAARRQRGNDVGRLPAARRAGYAVGRLGHDFEAPFRDVLPA